jgi:hypothetical protein
MYARMRVYACLCFVETNENTYKKTLKHGEKIHCEKFNLHFVYILRLNPSAIPAP